MNRWQQLFTRFFSAAPPVQLPRTSDSQPLLEDETKLSHLETTDSVKYIDTIADLKVELVEVEQAFAISVEAGHQRLEKFRYLHTGQFPPDPYSTEYAKAQMDLYYAFSNRTHYDPKVNEHSPFDLNHAQQVPFPYSTRDSETVGRQLIAQGHIIRAMALQPGSSIIEFGPGWGNLTLQLAQMGYDVTGVEIEHNFIELIKHRAERLGVTITLEQQDMAQFRSNRRYDVALFYACFHHCTDHLQLLRNLHDIVTPDGFVMFADEPISTFPQPWGFVRTESSNLWVMWRYGWFELGFDINYFLRTLLFFGWLPYERVRDPLLTSPIIVAYKSKGLYKPHELMLPPDEEATWHTRDVTHRFTTAQSVMSCAKDVPVQAIEFCVSNPAPFDLMVTFTAGTYLQQMCVPGYTEHMHLHVAVSDWQGRVVIASSTWSPATTLGTADQRMLGIAVHCFRLLDHIP
ncbi:MAG: class I SAM-dependent methyltransferase [Chloroflexota bacterium]